MNHTDSPFVIVFILLTIIVIGILGWRSLLLAAFNRFGKPKTPPYKVNYSRPRVARTTRASTLSCPKCGVAARQANFCHRCGLTAKQPVITPVVPITSYQQTGVLVKSVNGSQIQVRTPGVFAISVQSS